MLWACGRKARADVSGGRSHDGRDDGSGGCSPPASYTVVGSFHDLLPPVDIGRRTRLWPERRQHVREPQGVAPRGWWAPPDGWRAVESGVDIGFALRGIRIPPPWNGELTTRVGPRSGRTAAGETIAAWWCRCGIPGACRGRNALRWGPAASGAVWRETSRSSDGPVIQHAPPQADSPATGTELRRQRGWTRCRESRDGATFPPVHRDWCTSGGAG